MTHYLTQARLKKDFVYIRHLIRLLEKELKLGEADNYDWSESGDFGQLANELVACATSAVQYQEEHELGLHKVKSCGCPRLGETHQEGCELNQSLVN